METMSVVEQALVITVIGVVSIFAVLFILWGLMAALVRVTAPRTSAQPGASSVRDDAARVLAAIGRRRRPHVNARRRCRGGGPCPQTASSASRASDATPDLALAGDHSWQCHEPLRRRLPAQLGRVSCTSQFTIDYTRFTIA